MAKVFRLTRRSGKSSTHYYGKIHLGPMQWRRVKLYTDKITSARKLADLQREADQVDAGYRSAAAEALALPIPELRDRYLATLKSEGKNADHLRISEFM